MGVAQNDFLTIPEELQSCITMLFSLLFLIIAPITPDKTLPSSGNINNLFTQMFTFTL